MPAIGPMNVRCVSPCAADFLRFAEVEDQWYSPGATYFRVRSDDGNYYVLRHDEGMDVWTLDAFRASRDSDELISLEGKVTSGPHGVS